MVCQICRRVAPRPICHDCLEQLRPAPERILPGGLRLVAAFEHEGPARELVHNLKYRGVTTYADVVAAELRDRLPELPVVPVPRVWSRRIKYGVDPAALIASRLGRPVLRLLAPPLHSKRRAGGDHSRVAPVFRLRSRYLGAVIVLDDVVTSGATIMAAVNALGEEVVRLAASANIALRRQSSSNALRASDSALS